MNFYTFQLTGLGLWLNTVLRLPLLLHLCLIYSLLPHLCLIYSLLLHLRLLYPLQLRFFLPLLLASGWRTKTQASHSWEW